MSKGNIKNPDQSKTFASVSNNVQDFASSGLDESYRQAWEANPYAGQVATGGFLGFGKFKEQEQINQNARTYYADLINQARSEGYNSPEQQVQRLRDAGINPDISGGVSPDSSSPLGLEPQSIDYANPGEQALSLTDTLLNIAALSMSLPAGLAQLKSDRIDNAIKFSQFGSQLAREFPEEKVNIAPSGLAPVMVSNPISGERIASSVPGLSRADQKRLAKSFDLSRKSLKNQLSSFGDRFQLQRYLNSPEISMPREAAAIVQLESKIHLVELKYDFEMKRELAKHAQEIAKKSAENAVQTGEVVGKELSARESTAAAAKSVAAAQAAEAGVRSATAKATDGSAIGEANTEAAIVAKYKAKAASEQLRIIKEAEEEGLFHSSFVGDVLDARIHFNPKKTYDSFKRVEERRRKRTEAKRAHKNIYNGNYSGVPDVTISPKGVGVSID